MKAYKATVSFCVQVMVRDEASPDEIKQALSAEWDDSFDFSVDPSMLENIQEVEPNPDTMWMYDPETGDLVYS